MSAARPHLCVVPPADQWPARRVPGPVAQAHRLAEIDALRAACDVVAGEPQPVRSLQPLVFFILGSWAGVFGTLLAVHLITGWLQ